MEMDSLISELCKTLRVSRDWLLSLQHSLAGHDDAAPDLGPLFKRIDDILSKADGRP